jgi:hypothetical protein
MYLDMISARVSPGGIPRDIYIVVYSFFFLLSLWLCFLRVAIVPFWGVYGVWSFLVDLAACEIWL